MPSNEEKPLKSAGIFLFAIAVIALAIAVASIIGTTPNQGQTASISTPLNYFTDIKIKGKAAIVIDISTGKTLYEKNSDTPLPLASLTKVALALVVAEAVPQEAIIIIPYYARGSNGNAHLSKGEKWRVQDVIDFTLVTSSNAGAKILAESVDKTIRERYPEFPAGSATLSRMNEFVKELGLQYTYFLNVSGLDISTTQAGSYGSARDMAALFAYAASAESSLFSGTAQNGVLLASADGKGIVTAPNTNNVQGAIPGLIMGKTGLTDLAGGNLVVVFDVGLAHPVVAVVLGSTEYGRFEDMQNLVIATQKSIMKVE
ncbi:MAG: serine hydrolase [Patescibacteria group bacterium]